MSTLEGVGLNFHLILELERTTAKKSDRMLPKAYDTIGARKSPSISDIKQDLPIGEGNMLEQSAAEKITPGDDRLVMIYKVLTTLKLQQATEVLAWLTNGTNRTRKPSAIHLRYKKWNNPPPGVC